MRNAARCLLLVASRVVAVSAVAIGACSSEPRLLVDLRSDLAPGHEAVAASISVGDRAPTGVLIDLGDPLLDGLRVADVRLPAGTHVLEVQLRTLEGTLRRRAQVTLEGDFGVTVSFMRSCIGVVCPGDGDSPSASVCLRGQCVPETCIEGSEASCGEIPECGADDDCVDIASECALGRCVEGECVAAPDDALCDDGQLCTTTRGCVARERIDGGPNDAGPSDTGPSDAGLSDGGPSDAAMDVQPGSDGGPGAVGFDDVSIGQAFLCALREGSIYCSGQFDFGYGWVERTGLLRIGDLDDAMSISCGSDHCCVIRPGGSLSCFGQNDTGQLGRSGMAFEGRPEDVPGLSGVTEVAAGSDHTCASEPVARCCAGAATWTSRLVIRAPRSARRCRSSGSRGPRSTSAPERFTAARCSTMAA